MVSYDELKKARKTSGEILAEQKAHNPYGEELSDLIGTPLLEGYKTNPDDDEVIARLKIASHVMAQGGNSTLKPLLPMLLLLPR